MSKSKCCSICIAAMFIFLLQIFFAIPAFSTSSSVAVIYPEIRAPFNKIFIDIADGVEKKINGRTMRYMLKKDYSQQEFNQWLNENNIQACVALGQRGEKAVSALTKDMPVVLSGILTPKASTQVKSTVSLAPSPDKLFKKIMRLKQDINEIIVVYNPDKTGWLIEKAQIAADNNGVQLTAITTKSLSESAKIYRKLFKQKSIKNAAIWLPPDPLSVDNRTVLSFILDKSWSKGTAVFSSSLAHVNKGVLFAMYADNMKLGQRLGELALEELNGRNKKVEIFPVDELQTAFNRRTAEHLGIKVTTSDLRMYDAVFPSE